MVEVEVEGALAASLIGVIALSCLVELEMMMALDAGRSVERGLTGLGVQHVLSLYNRRNQ